MTSLASQHDKSTVCAPCEDSEVRVDQSDFNYICETLEPLVNTLLKVATRDEHRKQYSRSAKGPHSRMVQKKSNKMEEVRESTLVEAKKDA